MQRSSLRGEQPLARLSTAEIFGTDAEDSLMRYEPEDEVYVQVLADTPPVISLNPRFIIQKYIEFYIISLYDQINHLLT